MPRFSSNISTMFVEHEFLNRFAIARGKGFGAVEIQFPYDYNAADLSSAKDDAGVEITVINIDAGDLVTGGPGIAAFPGREDKFKSAVEVAYEYANELKPINVNVLSGCPPMDLFEREQCLDVLAENLKYAAKAFNNVGTTVLTEAVNTNTRPGFLLSTTAESVEIIGRADHQNLALQYDVFHMHLMEGDLVNTIKTNLDFIGHIQFADAPGRHEPGTGEIDFPNLFKALDDMGWVKWLAAEYIPSRKTEDTLGWMQGKEL